MSKRVPHEEPELIDFVSGYAGPAETKFKGGLISIVALLIYDDGICIEWRMRPETDLSWIADVSVDPQSLPEDLRRSPEAIQAHLNGRRLRALWRDSRLADGRGGEFQPWLKRSALFGDGWEGVAVCRCPRSDHAREFTLHIADTDVVIPLTSHPGRLDDPQAALFRTGVPGPRNAIPFRTGAVRLVSTLLYTDRVRIEWILDPVPDLSWLSSGSLLA
jgi:hypothetical protein